MRKYRRKSAGLSAEDVWGFWGDVDVYEDDDVIIVTPRDEDWDEWDEEDWDWDCEEW